MGIFLEEEKIRQARLKLHSPYFSDIARTDGIYRGKPRPFCLPHDCAEENLFPLIRESAPARFRTAGIKWHDGQKGRPSNHLCDSQVCCVNFLFPFANQPNALAALLRPLYPDIRNMLPMEFGEYVAFEWIGMENYLGEKTYRSGIRTRGANFTSADAAVMFERKDGKRCIVLIEWKYTESYSPTSLKYSRRGTDRSAIYLPLFASDSCPINKSILPSFDDLFYEPFYQLMRQQLLAHEMERARELGADIVSALHIAPGKNRDFRKVTSPALKPLGDSPIEIWKCLAPPNRFISISAENLFADFIIQILPEMREWIEYISMRYKWILEKDA